MLTLVAMVTLVYYDKLLKGRAAGSQSHDDEFQRVATPCQMADAQAIKQRQLIERKNILADAMNGGHLKRSASNNALPSGFSDSDSQYSRTTRNTL